MLGSGNQIHSKGDNNGGNSQRSETTTLEKKGKNCEHLRYMAFALFNTTQRKNGFRAYNSKPAHQRGMPLRSLWQWAVNGMSFGNAVYKTRQSTMNSNRPFVSQQGINSMLKNMEYGSNELYKRFSVVQQGNKL